MADLIEIPVGDQNGVEHINENFNRVNKAVQDMANAAPSLKFHNWSKDGIVMHNGFTMIGSENGYRYLELPGGWKLVELIIDCTLPDGNTFKGGDWFTLPDPVKPVSLEIKETVVGNLYTSQSDEGTVQLHPAGDSSAFKVHGWRFSLHTMYFTKS